MQSYSLIPAAALLLNCFVWSYIYAQKKNNPVNLSFLIYAADLTLWIVSVIMLRQPNSQSLIIPIMKAGSISWLTIIFAFLNFVYVFTGKKKDSIYNLFIFLSIVSIILNFSTDYITSGYIPAYWGYDEIHGQLFLPAVFFVIILPGIYSLYLLEHKRAQTKDITLKGKLNLIFIGSFITIVIGLLSNVIIPDIFNYSGIVKIAESATVIQSIFVFIAVIKYRLFCPGIEEAAPELFSRMHDAVVIMDVNGFIIQLNNAAKYLLHLEDYEPGGIHIFAVIDHHNINSEFQNLERELTIDNNYKIISITQTSITQNNTVTGKILIIRDITESKIAEKELIQSKEKAEEMNRLKSYFLANLSHELRTPMIGILGCSEIISQELENSELKQMADIISKSGKRLLDTLNSLLYLSRIEANETEIDIQEVEIGEIIKETYETFQALAEKENLKLMLDLQKDRVLAKVDGELFKEAVYHLVRNAIEFTNQGVIIISLNHVIEMNNASAIVKVIDTGKGIPKEYLTVIFEPFRQVSEGLSRESEGIGLGLTISKRFIELMGGKISVESEVGKGSVFTINVPASERIIVHRPAVKT